jgi:hypothetical protein
MPRVGIDAIGKDVLRIVVAFEEFRARGNGGGLSHDLLRLRLFAGAIECLDYLGVRSCEVFSASWMAVVNNNCIMTGTRQGRTMVKWLQLVVPEGIRRATGCTKGLIGDQVRPPQVEPFRRPGTKAAELAVRVV